MKCVKRHILTHSYKGQFEKTPDGWIYHTAAGYYDLAAGKHYWYLRDHLGSTVAVLDANGNYQQTTAYYPSGAPYQLPNTTLATDVDASTDRLHIGNRWLSHSGLNWYDNTARMHDPVLMHFATPDPLYAKYQDLSPWSHCAANPLNIIDPSGMDTYVLNEDGTFTLKAENQDADEIIAGNGDKLLLEYGTISSGISGHFKGGNGEADYTYYEFKKNGFKEFQFFAEHTNVEWDRLEFADCSSIVGTSNHNGKVASGAAFLKDNPEKRYSFKSYDHTHPDGGIQSKGDVSLAFRMGFLFSFFPCRVFNSTNFDEFHFFDGFSKYAESYEDGSVHMLDENGVVVYPQNQTQKK